MGMSERLMRQIDRPYTQYFMDKLKNHPFIIAQLMFLKIMLLLTLKKCKDGLQIHMFSNGNGAICSTIPDTEGVLS